MYTSLVELLESSSNISNNGNKYFLKDYLESCSEYAAFISKNEEKVVIKFINNSINFPGKEKIWLLTLFCHIQQISLGELLNNALFWMHSCRKVINGQSEIDGLSLKLLGTLVNLTVKFPEINKEVAKKIIPQVLLINVRRKSPALISIEFLECLQVFMRRYSGPTAEFKADIIKILLDTCEAKADIVRAAARCVPLISKLGGGGKQGLSHKNSWHKQQLTLVNILHLLLDAIYEHVNIKSDIKEEQPTDLLFSLDSVCEEDVHCTVQRLAKRFTAISLFLQAMLLDEFQVAKLVQTDAILDVVVYAQKPTHSTLGTSREALAVKSVLPAIQISAMRLLESLIHCVNKHLIPVGGLVSYLCSQVIIWTKEQVPIWPYAMEKPFRQTRLAAYCSLSSWLSIAGGASQVEALLKHSLTTILADIHSKKPTVKLNVSSTTNKNSKDQQLFTSSDDCIDNLKNKKANCHLCEKALDTLTLLVRSASSILTLDNYMNIKETVLTVAAELPIPYSDVKCRCALYQLLLALCTEPHPRAVPPYECALALLTSGLQHNDTKIKKVCSIGVTFLEKIIRPHSGNMFISFPVEKPNSKKRSVVGDPEVNLKKMRTFKDDHDDPEVNLKKMRAFKDDHDDLVVSIGLNGSESSNVSDEQLIDMPCLYKNSCNFETSLNDKDCNSSVVLKLDSKEILENHHEESSKNNKANHVKSFEDSKIEIFVESETSNCIQVNTPNRIDVSNLHLSENYNNGSNKQTTFEGNQSDDSAVVSNIETTCTITSSGIDSDTTKMLMDFNDEIKGDESS